MMFTSLVPVNDIVLVPAVNVPLFVKLLCSVWVKEEALNVTEASIVKVPFVVIFPAAVLVPPVDNISR